MKNILKFFALVVVFAFSAPLTNTIAQGGGCDMTQLPSYTTYNQQTNTYTTFCPSIMMPNGVCYVCVPNEQ